jgi:glycosyltransferase involved in cell wall biosynthesis
VRVLFIPTCNTGTSYWRQASFREAFTRLGVEAQILWYSQWDKIEEKERNNVHPWQSEIADPVYQARISGELEAYAQMADVIVLQYVSQIPALLTLYAFKDMLPHVPIVCEVDDDLTDAPHYNPGSESYGPGKQPLHLALEQIRNSDAVMTTTDYLKEVYSDYNPHVYVAENSIDSAFWNVKGKRIPGVRVGWSGGASHQEDLRLLVPVIAEFLNDKTLRDIKFVFYHYCPEFLRNFPNVEVVERWSKIDRYPKEMAALDCDVMLAPLVDNKFNRAKSNIRWLEAAALRVPCVASNVGHFAQTIRHGVDGFLANNTGDFVSHIKALALNKKLRKKVGTEAFKRTATDFNVDTVAAKYLSHLDEIIKRGPVAKAPTVRDGLDDMSDVKAFPLEQVVEAEVVPGVMQ